LVAYFGRCGNYGSSRTKVVSAGRHTKKSKELMSGSLSRKYVPGLKSVMVRPRVNETDPSQKNRKSRGGGGGGGGVGGGGGGGGVGGEPGKKTRKKFLDSANFEGLGERKIGDGKGKVRTRQREGIEAHAKRKGAGF